MQPQNQYPSNHAPEAPNPTPYDFITSSPHPSNNKLGKSKFAVIVGGALLLLVILGVTAVILSSGGNDNKQQVLNVVHKQQELIRVAQLGRQGARSTEAANLAITTQLSVTSSQQQLITAVKGKFSEKQLALSKNTDVDTKLEQATQASRFDEVFITIMQEKLDDYEKVLQQAYEVTASESTKAILNDSYLQAKKLQNEES